MSGKKSTLKLKKLHFIKNFGKINRRECVHWISNKKKLHSQKKNYTLLRAWSSDKKFTFTKCSLKNNETIFYNTCTTHR